MIVDIEDLVTDEDITLYQGYPFSGTMEARFPVGSLWREYNYVDGFEQGLCREWFSNGLLKREWFAVKGVAEGKFSEWHANGQIKSVAQYLKGVEMVYDEWTDAGSLVLHRELDRKSELCKYAHGENS